MLVKNDDFQDFSMSEELMALTVQIWIQTRNLRIAKTIATAIAPTTTIFRDNEDDHDDNNNGYF